MDTTMDRITAGIALVQSGERAAGRAALSALWTETSDPFHHCTIAHFLADAQDDVREELVWDLRALEAAERLTDGRVKAHHESLSLDAFFPSLHLNLAEDYRKLGDLAKAREHLNRAKERTSALANEGLGKMTLGAIARLEGELAAQPADSGDAGL